MVVDAMHYNPSHYAGDLAVRWKLQGGQVRVLQRRGQRPAGAAMQCEGRCLTRIWRD